MNKILVTGGFGFLGSHLVERLVQDSNNQVHVVDNLSSNPLPIEFLLDELGHPHNLSYTLTDVKSFCHGAAPHFDQIYHLASIVGPAGVLPHMGRIIESIVRDTYAVMRMALQNGARFVDISTSEVYGGGQAGLCSEEMPRIISANPSARLEYAVAKLAAETAILNTCRVTSLDAVIIRPFNIAGPRQSGRGGFVLPRFIGLALEHRPLTIFGNGEQVRAFTHVQDMADGIICVANSSERGQVLNIGNPMNRSTINELADAVLRLTASPSPKVYVDPKTIYGSLYEEALDKYPDVSKIMRLLHWRPKYSRDETIEHTIRYMQSLPKEMFWHLLGQEGSTV